MDKRFSWVFLVASGAFFFFIVGLTGYRIEDTRRHHAASSHESATALAARVHSLADTTGSIQSPLFANAMRDVFDAEPRLLLMCVRSERDGILYLLTRSRSYLAEPSTVTPDWRGTPTYQVNRGSEILVTAGVGSDMPGVTLDALYVVMGREDLYPVLRDDLYFFLAFLLVVGVTILIVMSIEDQEPSPARPAAQGPILSGGQDRGGWRPAPEPVLRPPGPVPAAAGTVAVPTEAPTRVTSPSAAPPTLSSPRSGLAWAEYLDPRLETEVERASSSDGEVSLARIRIDEPFADARFPLAYAEIAGILAQTFPLHDLLFEAGDDGYSVILPEADVDSAVRMLDELRVKVSAREIEGRIRTLSAGVSSRGGRLIESPLLKEEAQVALAKAEREGGNQVVGFRADAARFRQKMVVPTG